MSDDLKLRPNLLPRHVLLVATPPAFPPVKRKTIAVSSYDAGDVPLDVSNVGIGLELALQMAGQALVPVTNSLRGGVQAGAVEHTITVTARKRARHPGYQRLFAQACVPCIFPGFPQTHALQRFGADLALPVQVWVLCLRVGEVAALQMEPSLAAAALYFCELIWRG